MTCTQTNKKQTIGFAEKCCNLSRNAMIYLVIFGIISSILAWFCGEMIIRSEEQHPWYTARKIYSEFFRKFPNGSDKDFQNFIKNNENTHPEYSDNPYLRNDFINLPKENRVEKINAAESEINAINANYSIVIALIIALGFAIAEPCVTKNISGIIKNGLLAVFLGAMGGWVVSLFINQLYSALGGGGNGYALSFQQILARGIGWGILGLFVGIAPGIMLYNWKKIFLGCAGGFIGGLVGGFLFDLICEVCKSVELARFVNVVGLGTCTAVAVVLLENVAKNAWLRVEDGMITGKQFILYNMKTRIGSSSICEICLTKDRSVAFEHATIEKRNTGYCLLSNSKNPVYVNNAIITQHTLKHGDWIKIGCTVFVFESKK